MLKDMESLKLFVISYNIINKQRIHSNNEMEVFCHIASYPCTLKIFSAQTKQDHATRSCVWDKYVYFYIQMFIIGRLGAQDE